MPSAYEASRGFLANSISSIRSGISRADRALDDPGPDIKVEPFDHQNVSTAAGLIKLGTSIAAARRKNANFAESQKTAALEAEKTRAEIARLKAESEYYLGTGRQTSQPRSTEMTDYQKEMVKIAGRRLDQAAKREKDLAAGKSRLAQANAGLKQLDLKAKREVEDAVSLAISKFDPVFYRVSSAAKPDPNDLEKLGIDHEAFKNALPMERRQILVNAREAIKNRFRAGYTPRSYAFERQKYQAVIDQGIDGLGAGQIAPDLGGDQGGPSDDALIQAIMSLTNE